MGSGEMIAAAFSLILIACGVLLAVSYARGEKERRERQAQRQAALDRARHWREWNLDHRRPRTPLQIELERGSLWQPRRGRGAVRELPAGAAQPAAAHAAPGLAAGAGLRIIDLDELGLAPGLQVTGPGATELLPVTLTLRERERPYVTELISGTLLREGAGPEVTWPNQLRLLLNLQVTEPTTEILPQVDAGLGMTALNELESVPETLPQFDVETRAGGERPREPEPAGTTLLIGAGLRVTELSAPGPAAGTLLRADDSASSGRAAEMAADEVLSLAEGAGLPVVRLTVREVLPGILPRVSAGPQPPPAILLQFEANLQASAAGEPEPVTGLRVTEPRGLSLTLAHAARERVSGPEPVSGTLLQSGTLLPQVDAGPHAEPAPGTLPRPSEVAADVVVSLAAGAGLPPSALTWHQGASWPVAPHYTNTPIPATRPVALRENLSPGAAEHFVGDTPLPNTPAVYNVTAPPAPDSFDFVADTPTQLPPDEQPVARLGDTFYRPQPAATSALPTVAFPDYDSGRLILRPHFRDDLTFALAHPPARRPEPVSEIRLEVDAGLRATRPNEPQLVAETLSLRDREHTREPAPAPVTLPHVGARLQVTDLNEPEPAPGLRVIEPSGTGPAPGLRVSDPVGPEPVAETLLQADANLRLEPGILLPQADAGLRPELVSGTLLRADEEARPERTRESYPVPGLQTVAPDEPEPVLGTPLQVDAGLRGIGLSGPAVSAADAMPAVAEGAGLWVVELSEPEPVPGTLLRVNVGPLVIGLSEPSEAAAGVAVSLAGGGVLQVNDPGGPELVPNLQEIELRPVTLPGVDDAGSDAEQTAEFTADDLKAAFEMFVAPGGEPAGLTADDVKAAFEMFMPPGRP